MSILSIEDLEFHYFCILSYITSLEIPSPLLMVLILFRLLCEKNHNQQPT